MNLPETQALQHLKEQSVEAEAIRSFALGLNHTLIQALVSDVHPVGFSAVAVIVERASYSMDALTNASAYSRMET
jgi:hypothetical protein